MGKPRCYFVKRSLGVLLNMEQCPICGDTKTENGECFYCDWKGYTGAGKTLKEIIQKKNLKGGKNGENGKRKK